MNGITLTTISSKSRKRPAVSSRELVALLGKPNHHHLLDALHKIRKRIDGRFTMRHIIVKKVGTRVQEYLLTEEGVGMVLDWFAKYHKKVDYAPVREALAAAFAQARKGEAAPVQEEPDVAPAPAAPEQASSETAQEPPSVDEKLQAFRGAIVEAVRDAMNEFFETHQLHITGSIGQRLPK